MFRNEQNVRLTQALFLEEALNPKSFVLFTLRDEDRDGYPSLYRLYMECSDPTEFEFAKKHLGGWDNWSYLCQAPFFKPYIARWRKELELKIRAEALRNVREIAKDQSSKHHYEANKFLLTGHWKQTRVGRPSKAEIKAEAESFFDTAQEDLDRIRSIAN